MMKVLIIEDEIKAADLLKKKINSIDDSIEVVAIIDSIDSAVKWFEKNEHPDLIFLDIQLSDGLSFNIFKQTDVCSPIIFTTAYDEYALNAFELNSVDYLLKPISEDKLLSGIEKFKNLQKALTSRNRNIEENKQLANLSINQNTFKSRFLINKGDYLHVVSIDQIAYFISEDKLLFVVTKDNKKHIYNDTLDRLVEKIDPMKFFRINRQMIVGIDSITKINNYFNYKLKLEVSPPVNDDNTVVSRAKVKGFKDWVGQ